MTGYMWLLYMNGLIVYLEIFLTNLGGILLWSPDLFSFRLRISNSTSFSVTGWKKIDFRDLSSRLFEKLISLTGILVAKFGQTLIKYSLNLLLISY